MCHRAFLLKTDQNNQDNEKMSANSNTYRGLRTCILKTMIDTEIIITTHKNLLNVKGGETTTALRVMFILTSRLKPVSEFQTD